MLIVKSLFFFFLAGLCEIGGGYLFWQWLREGRSITYAVVGGALLVLYGVFPTFQPAHFGRIFAAYGGVFVIMSVWWGWQIDGIQPDRYDLIGSLIALVGVLIIMYAPRTA